MFFILEQTVNNGASRTDGHRNFVGENADKVIENGLYSKAVSIERRFCGHNEGKLCKLYKSLWKLTTIRVNQILTIFAFGDMLLTMKFFIIALILKKEETL